jgi:hypothetical protein
LNTITNSISRDTQNTEQIVDPVPSNITLDDLKVLYASWLKEGHEQFDDLCLITGELGEYREYPGGRIARVFSYSYLIDKQQHQAEITFFQTKGAFLPKERQYSQTRSIGVNIDGKQVAYLRQSTDPGTPSVSQYYVPGHWEEPLTQYVGLAKAKIQERKARIEEAERQKLYRLLFPGLI